jgi:hypothetical protein
MRGIELCGAAQKDFPRHAHVVAPRLQLDDRTIELFAEKFEGDGLGHNQAMGSRFARINITLSP